MSTKHKQQLQTPSHVNRNVLIPKLADQQCADKINNEVNTLEGIGKVEIDIHRKKVHLNYDASKLQFDQLRSVLFDMGYPISISWWSRIKAAIYQYQDENIRDNAASGDGACCSNPTDIYAKSRRK